MQSISHTHQKALKSCRSVGVSFAKHHVEREIFISPVSNSLMLFVKYSFCYNALLLLSLEHFCS